IPRLLADECTGHRGEIGDDAALRIAVPRAKYVIHAGRAATEFRYFYTTTHADAVRGSIHKVIGTRTRQVALQFCAPLLQKSLGLLGGFELKIFPQIAVAAREADGAAVLGNFFVHNFVQLGLPTFKTGPGYYERLLLLLLLTH